MCDAQERGEQRKAWTSPTSICTYLRSHGSAGLSYYVPTAARNLSFDNYSFLAAGKVLGRGSAAKFHQGEHRGPEAVDGTPRWYKFTF